MPSALLASSIRSKVSKIVWPAVIAATLAAVSVLSSLYNSELSLALGLSAITSALLAVRN